MAIKCPKCRSDNPDTSRFCGSCATPLAAEGQPPVSMTKTIETHALVLSQDSLIAGKYRILEKLGSGGMGVVYRAEDTRLGRSVALKFLPDELSQNPLALERFQREAKAASALNHPNISTIHEIDEFEGRQFIAMEFLDGQTLRQRILGAALDTDDVLNLGIQIADGLDAAHSKGIVHRDIKPANIFITKPAHVKILDFGLAKLAPEAKKRSKELVNPKTMTKTAEEFLTSPGTAIGTVAYMSPEQALGKDLDARTDLFSLGVVLYEMVTGIPPFRGDTSAAIFDEILHKAPTAPVRLNPRVPDELERIINKALEKDREVRYQSAKEILVDLKRLKRDTDSGKVATKAPIAGRMPWFKKPMAKYVLVAGTLFLAAMAIYQVWKPVGKAQVPSSSQPTHKQITFLGDAFDPALSPDGKSVAYLTGRQNEENRLMLQDLSGGQAVELLRANSLHLPKWSPDGSELIFVKYNDDWSLAIMLIPRLGGASRTIADGNWACWSPDGAHIAAAHPNEKGFRIVDKSTGDTKTISLKEFPCTWNDGLDWSGTANLLAIMATMENGRNAIWTVRPDGKQLRKMVEEESLMGMDWSSAGDAIYFFRNKGETQELAKLSINTKTGEARGAPSVLLTGLQTGFDFTISGRGTRLAYTRSQGHSNLWLGEWPGLGKDRKPQLKPLTTGTSVSSDPAISPDGQWIAFISGPPWNIYKMRVDGGTPIKLTFSNTSHYSPAWSPDGKRIAFGLQEATGCRVWIMDSDGGKPRPLIKTKMSSTPLYVTWSPGHDILYQRPGNRNFSLLDPETEQEKPLIKDESVGFALEAKYSPDGKKIAVFWNREQERLWVISLANNEAKLLTGSPKPIGWSPDGKWIYAHDYVHRGVVSAVPVDGGKPVNTANLPGEVEYICVSPDGRKFVCSIGEMYSSDIWVVENFDPHRK